MNQKKMGKLIAQVRKEKKLTQKELSDKLGIGDKAISKWERGINAPDISILKKLCYELDISVVDLLNAIKNLKADAGLTDTSSVVTLNIMKALLSMDYFYSYDNSERTQNIISMQRYLNRNYEAYIGLRPCDGIYGRSTNKAMIFAIQAEEGLGVNANGNCGDATKSCLPNLVINATSSGTSYTGQSYSQETLNKFKILANMLLYFNGFGNGNITSVLDESVIKQFQANYSIPITGNVDYTTWLSLLVSCGDINRSAIACDCITRIIEDNVEVLKNNNYKYIGRYLVNATNGIDKKLTKNELKVLFKNGIRLFPIYQTNGAAASNFTTAVEDFKLEFGAIIYFAVDYDATDAEITNRIIPYFSVLHSVFINHTKGKYRVGVYATRNVCTRICEAGYACSSFVSDMSTGYSGNLGFPIPDNWAMDQFHTTIISSNGKSITIDKDGFSGKYLGISQEYSDIESEDNFETYNTTKYSHILVNRSESNIPVYDSKVHINHPLPTAGTQYGTSGNIVGQIKPNDFYVFFGLTSAASDCIHKVLFNNNGTVKMGYITGKNYPGSNETLTVLNENHILDDQKQFVLSHYLPETNGYKLEDYKSTAQVEFLINKPVVYFNSNGKYEGTLDKGDKVVISKNYFAISGASRPWCHYVDKIIFKNGKKIDTYKFVSVCLEYGTSGKDRAWY